MIRQFRISLGSDREVSAVRVQSSTDLPQALQAIGLLYARPAVAVVGGADKMTWGELLYARSLFYDVLAPLAEEQSLFIVDGGTDTGVMRLMGEARERSHATFPLVGVAPADLVVLDPANTPRVAGYRAVRQVVLEPHHSSFVFVPGSRWGDEAPWISNTTGCVAGPFRSATVLVNGGNLAFRDALYSILAHRPVLVLENSGRTADRLVKAIRNPGADREADDLVTSGLFHILSTDHNQSAEKISRMLHL